MTTKSSVFFKSQGPVAFHDFAECFVGVQWHELIERLGGPYLIYRSKTGAHMVVELRSYKSVHIGRSMACQVMIEDSSISRTHALLERVEDRWLLRDLISSYGTHVDGNSLLEVHELKSEDIFRVGKRVELLFVEKSDVIPLLFNEFSRRLNDRCSGESDKSNTDHFGSWSAEATVA
jgi:hypothetical protein